MSVNRSGKNGNNTETIPLAESNGSVSALFGSCPLPIFDHKQIVLGHGSGGKLTAELVGKNLSSRIHQSHSR